MTYFSLHRVPLNMKKARYLEFNWSLIRSKLTLNVSWLRKMKRWSSPRGTSREWLKPCRAHLNQRLAAGMKLSDWRRRWRETSMRWRFSSARLTDRHQKPRSNSRVFMDILKYALPTICKTKLKSYDILYVFLFVKLVLHRMPKCS